MPIPGHEGTHAPTPVTSARRAPEMRVSLSSSKAFWTRFRSGPRIWKLVQRRTVSCIAGGGQWRADMAKTVAGQFAEDLAAAGVKRIHGVVGDSLNGLTDALRRQGKIEFGTRRSRRCRGAPDG